MEKIMILLLCVTQSPAGMLDAFRSNFAATKAEIEFEYDNGFSSLDSLDRLRSWAAKGVSIDERLDKLAGRWICDGNGVHLTCVPVQLESKEVSPEVIREAISKHDARGPAASPFFLPTGASPRSKGFEVISDGEIQAEHKFDTPGQIDVRIDDAPAVFLRGRDPYCWWGAFRFPSSIASDFSKSVTKSQTVTIEGFHLSASIYQQQLGPGKWYRFALFQDPSVGYLPRYVQYVAVADDMATCKEMFLTDAKPCAAGGFVPLEYYEAEFVCRVPSYSETPKLDMADAPRPRGNPFKLIVGHFKANRIADFEGQVGLDQLKGAHTLSARAGQTPLTSEETLTVERIKSLLGKKLTDPGPVGPTLDTLELNEFTEQARGSWNWPVILGASGIAVVGIVAFWLRKRSSSRFLASWFLLFIGEFAGCAQEEKPIVRLTAAFDNRIVLQDNGVRLEPLPLIVRNSGSARVVINKVDGGCPCSVVDSSSLPATLEPGGARTLRVQITNPPKNDREQYRLVFRTNHGDLEIVVDLTRLTRHTFSPSSMGAPYLTEEQGWRFEFVHRFIHEPGPELTRVSLIVPPELSAKLTHTKRGRVKMAQRYLYEDLTYECELQDKTLGLRKSVIALKDQRDAVELEFPVVWRRVAYLSTVPEQVFVGARPIRVFLRCPDGKVELTKVLTAPKGVNALLCSTREVTVALEEGAPPSIDGFVEVATTALDKPPLRIPVKRYSIPALEETTMRHAPNLQPSPFIAIGGGPVGYLRVGLSISGDSRRFAWYNVRDPNGISHD